MMAKYADIRYEKEQPTSSEFFCHCRLGLVSNVRMTVNVERGSV
jgi:hypothetical protein